jgi:hypothetical protein
MSELNNNIGIEENDKIITITKIEELNKYINEEGIIDISLHIRGLEITKLIGVKKISKHLFLGDTEFEDLGDLEIIEGDFSIWNKRNILKLNSLGKLKKVNGDLNLRFTNIKCLGSLNYVGGNLNIRDTEITNLSLISKVGKNIDLPKKLKSIINISHIEIGGKVKYWNQPKKLRVVPTLIEGLTKSEIEIPHWEFKYITSHEEIQHTDKSIRRFYRYFRESFLNGIFIDVRGETNYLFTLLLEILHSIDRQEYFHLIKTHLKNLSEFYPVLRHYTTRWMIELLEENNDYDYLKELLLDERNEYIISLLEYFFILNHTKENNIDPNFIWKETSTSSLTNYGLNNLEEIKEKFKLRLINLNTEIIENFKNYVRKWNKFNEIIYDNDTTSELSKITSFFEREIRESENDLRLSKGLPKIGEGWISETELYYNIKNNFSNYKVIHHGKPQWLGRQHLDIYIEELNIGLEYQGKQHSQSVEYFGGETSFYKQVLLDEKKRKLCEENSCKLIEVFPDYNLNNIIKEIETVINKNNI